MIDATTSLAETIDSLYPGLPAAHRLVAAAEAFQRRSPDESTEEDFMTALDHLLYALSNEVNEVPHGMFVGIDDLHLANEGRVSALLEGLLALSSTGAPIPMVLTSATGPQTRPLPSGLDEIELRPLTNADLADIAQRRGVIASPEIIRMIGDYVDGRPGYAIQVVELAAAKGIVDAHTVRAVIAEAQRDDAERAARLEADRMAALVRTAPLAGTSAHLSEVKPVQPVQLVQTVVQPVNPLLADLLEDTPPLMSYSPAPVVQAPVVHTPAPAPVQAPVVQPPVVHTPAPAPVHAPVVHTPTPEPTVVFPVVEAPPAAAQQKVGQLKFQPVAAMPQRVPSAPAKPAVAPQKALAANERRVLQTIATMHDMEGTATATRLKRALGETSRFAGAASPVSDALAALARYGLIEQTNDALEVTATGRSALS
jgi:hypothetical protein